MLVGFIAGLLISGYSILTGQPPKGIGYLERYVFWPAASFLVGSFGALSLKVLHYAIFREWLSRLSENSFREPSVGLRGVSKNAYVFVLCFAGAFGAYFVATNLVMLVTGQIFVALQNR